MGAILISMVLGQDEAPGPIRWESSFEKALAEAAERKRPVLWVHAFGSSRPGGGC